MEQTKKTSFVAGAAILAFAGVLCKIIGEAGMVYYEVVFPFYSWLLIISSSGVPTAISRMVSERFSTGDFAGARRVFRRALILLAVVGLVTTAVLYFGASFFANSVLGKDDSYILSFTSLAPALFFVSCMCAYRGYLQGAQHMTGTGLSQLTEQVIKCVVGLMLAARWISRGPEYGAAGLLLGITVSEFVALLVVMAFRIRNRRLYMPIDASRTPADDRPVIPELLRIAIPITLGASIIPITSMLDVKMIFACMGRYMDEAAVNQRYVALSTNVRSLINLPASLTTALAMSIVPAISGARARRDREGMHHFAGLGLKLSMAIGMPCAVGLFVLGGPIIQMLFRSIQPESLAVATSIMRVASLSVIFISLVQTMTGALQGSGHPRHGAGPAADRPQGPGLEYVPQAPGLFAGYGRGRAFCLFGFACHPTRHDHHHRLRPGGRGRILPHGHDDGALYGGGAGQHPRRRPHQTILAQGLTI